MLLQLVLEGLEEKGTREFGVSWVLGEGVWRELRKGNLGDSAAETVRGFVARNSVMVSEGVDKAQKQHVTDFTALDYGVVC